MNAAPGPTGQTFPCKQCGAELRFDASTSGMACPYCGFKQAVVPGALAGPAGGAMIREIPLERGVELSQRGLGAPVTAVQCRDCGATVNVGQGERTTKCAFCGSQSVLTAQANDAALRPESLVPFGIAKDAANAQFGKWLGGLWFRPNDLKKMAKVQEMGGVYIPYWTYNANVASEWRAERGHYYYETEVYQADENGQTVTRERQVQRTRWEDAWGRRRDAYKNVLVCAGKGLPTALADRFSTFDVQALLPYRPEYLAGWRAEQYAIELLAGWQLASQRIAAWQEERCAKDVGGDTHRSLYVQNAFDAVTFKHVLLPIWIAVFRYGDKPFQFLVNGQTGEVVGKAPWSVVKIVLFVLLIVALVGGGVAAYLLTQNQ